MLSRTRRLLLAAFIALAASVPDIATAQSRGAPAQSGIEYAFSPSEGARELVIKAVDSAQKTILVMAYNFSSREITSALVDAARRGVQIAMVIDYKANVSADRSGSSRRAVERLLSAGVKVRTIRVYAIAHDKVMIVDGKHVETGSFNYTASAASRNSENVLVVWNNPALARGYEKHWRRNWDQGQDWR